MRRLLYAALALGLATGGAFAQVPAYRQLPPPRNEFVPPPPYPHAIWVPGRWLLAGQGFAWTQGHYQPGPGERHFFAADRWERSGREHRREGRPAHWQ